MFYGRMRAQYSFWLEHGSIETWRKQVESCEIHTDFKRNSRNHSWKLREIIILFLKWHFEKRFIQECQLSKPNYSVKTCPVEWNWMSKFKTQNDELLKPFVGFSCRAWNIECKLLGRLARTCSLLYSFEIIKAHRKYLGLPFLLKEMNFQSLAEILRKPRKVYGSAGLKKRLSDSSERRYSI